MVQRCHPENPLADAVTPLGVLEVAHLQHHRDGFGHKDATHDEKHDFLAHDDRDRAERAAQRQRADITHEDLRGIGVEPEKGQTGTGNGAAKDDQLSCSGHIRNQQIFRKHRIAGHIGEQAERRADQHRRHDRQSVGAVGEVDRIAGADDHEIGEDDESEHAQRIGDRLEERHDQIGPLRQIDIEAGSKPLHRQRKHFCIGGCRHGKGKVDRSRQPDQRLPEILGTGRQTLRIAVDHLAVIIDPADRAKTERYQQHRPDEAVAQIRPQQRGKADADQNQRAAHCRRARLGQMGLRPVGTHRLADLHLRELADQPGPG